MVTGIVIPADADKPVRVIDMVDSKAIARTVGGLMEAVDLHDLGVTVYVNDSGLVQGLPFNSRASFLWWYHVPTARQQATLVGDAVIVGLPDDEGADTEVSTAARSLLLAPGAYSVEVQIAHEDWQLGMPVLPDFWEAIRWAVLLLDVVPGATDTRIVPTQTGRRAAWAA